MAERAFLTVAAWGEGWDERRRVESIVHGTGMDPATARLRVAREPPLVIGLLDEVAAADAVRVLRELGARACAPTQAKLSGIGAPLRAKRLVRAEGAPRPMYMVEGWRGEAEGLVMDDVVMFVRAALRRSETRTGPADTGDDSVASSMWLDPETRVLRGVVAGAMGGESIFDSGSAPKSRRVQASYVLDIYRRDATRVRVHSDKFSFDVLGDDRGLSDAENITRFTLRLVEEAPRAIIDEGFGAFRPAPGMKPATRRRTVGVETVVEQDEAVSFDFYAAWIVFVHRELGRRG